MTPWHSRVAFGLNIGEELREPLLPQRAAREHPAWLLDVSVWVGEECATNVRRMTVGEAPKVLPAPLDRGNGIVACVACYDSPIHEYCDSSPDQRHQKQPISVAQALSTGGQATAVAWRGSTNGSCNPRISWPRNSRTCRPRQNR